MINKKKKKKKAPKILVKCPKCEKIYKKVMKNWTGLGMPRKFCHSCNILLSKCPCEEF